MNDLEKMTAKLNEIVEDGSCESLIEEFKEKLEDVVEEYKDEWVAKSSYYDLNKKINLAEEALNIVECMYEIDAFENYKDSPLGMDLIKVLYACGIAEGFQRAESIHNANLKCEGDLYSYLDSYPEFGSYAILDSVVNLYIERKFGIDENRTDEGRSV